VTPHPSQYALDRVALGEPPPPALGEHLATCPRCAAAVAERGRPAEAPAWLARLGAPRPARTPRRTPWRAWIMVPALAAAAVAGVLVIGNLREPSIGGDEDLRPKGAPRIALYVKRGEAVSTWDGRSPVRPDDRLRVGVRSGGYAHVSVASLPDAGAPQVLYAGPLAQGTETLLPLSFRVDERAGDEVVSIVVSARPVDPSAHVAPGAPRGSWAQRLRIPKEVRP